MKKPDSVILLYVIFGFGAIISGWLELPVYFVNHPATEHIYPTIENWWTVQSGQMSVMVTDLGGAHLLQGVLWLSVAAFIIMSIQHLRDVRENRENSVWWLSLILGVFGFATAVGCCVVSAMTPVTSLFIFFTALHTLMFGAVYYANHFKTLRASWRQTLGFMASLITGYVALGAFAAFLISGPNAAWNFLAWGAATVVVCFAASSAASLLIIYTKRVVCWFIKRPVKTAAA